MKSRWWWLALLLLGLGLCLLVTAPLFESAILFFLKDHLARFAHLVDENRVFALVIYITIYVACTAASFPSAVLLTLTGGFFFGAFLGATAAAFSATLGGLCAFLAARTLSGSWSRMLGGFDLSRMIGALEQDATSYLMFLRLTPVFPFWLINLAAAVARVRLTTFLWTTFFGVMPAGFAFATAGEALGGILERQAALYRDCVAQGSQVCNLHIEPVDLIDPVLFIALLVLASLALIPVAMKRVPQLARFCERRGWLRAARRGATSGGEP
ncbi:MAG: TVP38/TMEM64 family protein [Hyphomicrobiales bacterium]|nr:TVP38/TMEM64 family protein [Hyphomicrobiales bacterium]